MRSQRPVQINAEEDCREQTFVESAVDADSEPAQRKPDWKRACNRRSMLTSPTCNRSKCSRKKPSRT